MNSERIVSRKIIEWTDGFKSLYQESDKNRCPEEFWNAAMAHISGIGEAIRRNHYVNILKSAAHAFCWITCYIKNCNETEDLLFSFKNDLSQIVGLKYPKKCGHCIRDVCECNPEKMDKEEDKAAKYSDLFKKWKDVKFETYSIDDWLGIFWKIFSGQIHLLTLEGIGFHLLEEAGEEAKAVRQLIQFRGILSACIEGIDESYLKRISNIKGLVEEYTKSMNIIKDRYESKSDKEALKKIDLKDKSPEVLAARLVKGKMDFIIEIADTFSWFCGVLIKLLRIIENEALDEELIKNFHIEEALKRVYKSPDKTQPLICYACKQALCKCLFYPKKID